MNVIYSYGVHTTQPTTHKCIYISFLISRNTCKMTSLRNFLLSFFILFSFLAIEPANAFIKIPTFLRQTRTQLFDLPFEMRYKVQFISDKLFAKVFCLIRHTNHAMQLLKFIIAQTAYQFTWNFNIEISIIHANAHTSTHLWRCMENNHYPSPKCIQLTV